MVALYERRTQAERRSRSEDALLDAAAQLISERGVQGSSLASIGDRAGVSRGLPTHHFGSKDVLVARLAQRAQERIAATMAQTFDRYASQTGDDPSALDVVRLTVDSYFEMFQHPTADERALLVMWGSTFPSASSVGGMDDAERRSYEGLSDVVATGHRDGSIRPDADPDAIAVLIHGLMRGVASLLLASTDAIDTDGVRSTCQQWITAALGNP